MPTALIAALSPTASEAAAPVSPFGTGPGATGPPGGSSLAALFASLLAGTYAPPAVPVSALPVSALPRPSLPVPNLTVPALPAAQLPSSLLTSVSTAAAETDTLGSGEKTGEAKKEAVSQTDKEAPDTVPLPVLLTPVLAPPPPPLLGNAKAAADAPGKDAKASITLEKPMDTAPAFVPRGESLFSPAAPAHAALNTGVNVASLTPEVRQAPATGSLPQPAPSAAPPVEVPSVNIPAANIPALQTLTADTRTVALPNVALAVAGVGDGFKPSFLPSNKTPQKDLKIVGGRADTITSTQTELPRLTQFSRNTLPTDGHPTDETLTDGTLTDGHPTEEPHTEDRRTDAGQGQAAPPAGTPLLRTGAAAAAGTVTETKALTHTEKLAIVQQLADGAGGMRLSAKPGAAEEMTVQLHPKDWGSLHVTVQIAPNTEAPAAADPARGDAPKAAAPKTVTAQIVAETPQVKAALELHSGELRDKLREAGLHLDTVTVTVRVPDAGKLSGMTPQGGQADTQGRFQDGAQGSMTQGSMTQGGTQGSSHGGTQSQGSTQGSDFGQRLAETGRPDGSLSSSAGPALSGGGTGSSPGSFQGGQHGSQTPRAHWAGADLEPEPDIAPRWATSHHSGAVRLDLRA